MCLVSLVVVTYLFFQSYEVDSNRDGKNDWLNIEIQVPLESSEKVHSVQLLLVFDYKLHVSIVFFVDIHIMVAFLLLLCHLAGYREQAFQF